MMSETAECWAGPQPNDGSVPHLDYTEEIASSISLRVHARHRRPSPLGALLCLIVAGIQSCGHCGIHTHAIKCKDKAQKETLGICYYKALTHGAHSRHIHTLLHSRVLQGLSIPRKSTMTLIFQHWGGQELICIKCPWCYRYCS